MDEGYVTDLSSVGCAIETHRILIPDEYIQLHLILPKDGLRVRIGKVRWSMPQRAGIEFFKIG